MNRYYIADLHFGHKNALRFDSRPFATIEEHDEELIRRWNSVVHDDDEVWVLGDISWLPPKDTVALLDRMKGVKVLITGNHDKNLCKNQGFCDRFQEITPYKELHLSKGFGVVLSHYPIPCFNRHFSGWAHLYGHVHLSDEWRMMEGCRAEFERMGKKCEMINVGCMLPYMDYTPRTLEEIAAGYEVWRKGQNEAERNPEE